MDEQLLQCIIGLSASVAEAADEEGTDGQTAEATPIIGAHELDTVRACVEHLDVAREEDAADFWRNIVQSGQVSFLQLTKALGVALRSPQQAWACCMFYSTLLRLKGCPVSSLFDPYTFSSFLQALKRAAAAAAAGDAPAASKAKPAQQKKGGARRKRKGRDTVDEHEVQEDSDGAEADAGAAAPAAVASSSGAVGDAGALCLEALANLLTFIRGFGLKEYPEMLAILVETCVDITRTGNLPVSTRAVSSRGARAGSQSEACYMVMCALLDPKHGDVGQVGCMLMHRLLPSLLGLSAPAVAGAAAAKKGAAQETSARRNTALQFVLAAFREHSHAVLPGVRALVRQLCLRVLDKADQRAAAVASVRELVAALPPDEQLSFCTFLFRLAHTAKPLHRLIALEVANCLLMELPAPFAMSSGYKAFVDGSHGPGEEIAAPWSAICLGLLLQRCDDKAAAVRARALSNLAECLEMFRALLAASGGDDVASDGVDDDRDDDQRDVRNVAEGFLLALCGGHVLSSQVTQVPVVRPKAAAPSANPSVTGTAHAGVAKKKRGGRQSHKQARGGGGASRRGRRGGGGAAECQEEGEGGSEGEQEEQLGGGEQAQGQQQQQGGEEGDGEEVVMVDEVVLVLPSRVRLDLGRLMTCAHRRVRDDKAPVRKAALSLLESALLLRGGLAAPVGQPPSLADITAVEAATADSLLSVRKAALAAASRLVAAFPEQIACCELWVRAALPLVRDSEVSIQEALLDQFSSLVLDKVAAAGTNKHGAEGAIRAVKPLLSALTLSSKGGAACAAKACSLLAQKHALHSKQVAKGLEALIATSIGHVKEEGEPPAAAAAISAAAATAHGDMAAKLVRLEVQGAWTLLREVAACDASAPSWQFLRSAWAQLQAQGRAASGEEGAQLLWVISHAASRFPAEDAAALAKELLQALLAFSLPPAAAAAHIAALHRLTTAAAAAAAATAENGPGHPQPSGKGAKGRGSSKNAAGAPSQWCTRVLEAAHEVLVKAVERRGTADAAMEWRACAALFAAGEVVLLREARPPSALVVHVQALTSPTTPSALLGTQAANSLKQEPGTSQNAHERTSQNAHERPSQSAAIAASGSAAAQGHLDHLATSQGAFGRPDLASSQGCAPKGGSAGPAAASCALQGHAWLCLGKLCLVDEGLAKRVVPLFVQELQRSPSPVVRNNCLVALADMCIHYTAMVDGYLPRLAGLIRDPHELVRRQALALLANLLMKDYVKWRGALFHRFALALVDTSPAVRNLAEYLLGDTLAVKAPLLAYNHFVEALFMLNGCQAGLHAGRIGGGGGGGSSQPQQSQQQQQQQQQQQPGVEAGSDMYSLKGSTPGIRAQRDTIYFTLLRRMSPEHKFATQAKLVAEVLGAVADGLLPLHEAGAEEVLGDALRLLGSKEIKVSASRMVAGDEDALMASGVMGGEGATQAVAEVAKAKGKLVSAMMKKHLVESVIPLLIELKHMLQEARHPMLGQLMTCMAAMLKDYKAEIEDILVTDKQLAKELLFDMKQAEQAAKQQQQQQAGAARRAAGMPGTPLPRPPHHTHQQQQHPGGHTPGNHVGGPSGDGPASASHTPARAAQAAGRTQGEGSTQQAGQEGVPLQPPQPAARTPGAKLLAARRATPGGASRRNSAATPYSTAGAGRVSIGGVAAPGMVLSAAPLSAAKAAHARSRLAVVQRGGDSDDGSDSNDGEGARVQLPGVMNEPQVQRQWNVKLGERVEEGKGGRRQAKPDPGKGKGAKAGGGKGRQGQVQQQTTEEVVQAVADLAATSEGGQLGDGSQQQRQHVQDDQGEGRGAAAEGSRKQGRGGKSAFSKAGPGEKSVKVKEEPDEGDSSKGVQEKSGRSPSAGRKRRKN